MDTSNTQDPVSDVLSQSDVERLLAEVAAAETPVVTPSGSEAGQGSPSRPPIRADQVQPYDFRQPAFLSAGELRKLRIVHEEFIRSLTARLSIYLRLEFALQMSRLQTMTYQKFCESFPTPCHLTLFKVEPMRGVCLLDIHPRLGMTIVDRLLGGPAHSVNLNHDLSEIEITLLDQAIQIILNEWCNNWHHIQELRPVLVGHENNGRFLQTSPNDAVMLVLGMEARLGDCIEQIQLGIPFYTLEPIVTKLNESGDGEDERSFPKSVSQGMRWAPEFATVRIPVGAFWHGLEMSARDLVNLKVGDVVTLDPEVTREARIRLSSLSKFAAVPGTQSGRWALQITRTLTDDETSG